MISATDLHFTPIVAEQICEFVQWSYAPPYDIYNIIPGSKEELADQVTYHLQPDVHAHAITTAEGELLAICTFGKDAQVPGGDYSGDALDIGLGVRPDLTGRGLGRMFTGAVSAFAQRKFEPRALRVTIAEFNVRAQRVWIAHGFEQVQRFERVGEDRLPFLILRKRL